MTRTEIVTTIKLEAQKHLKLAELSRENWKQNDHLYVAALLNKAAALIEADGDGREI